MPDHFFVYPEYLSRSATRALGRRVPARVALEEVTLEAIVQAAARLGFTAVAEPEKHYPRQYHRYAGRVKVTKRAGVTKARFLHQLAETLHPAGPAPKE
jgi:signal recognition particle subunit SEC65